MTVFIDPPMWPAHGTLWSHLISDMHYDEIHEFAKTLPLPRRSFDLDHYDVPEHLYARAVELGAVPISANELTRKLRASGLRVRQIERSSTAPVRRREYLQQEWVRLGAGLDLQNDGAWQDTGEALLKRWSEPHRHYHDERHLEHVLLSLDHLETLGEPVSVNSRLALWYHDAVYEGTTEHDESDSARVMSSDMAELGLSQERIARVTALILATIPGRPVPTHSLDVAHVLDSDVSIFAAGEDRYRRYAEDVRLEYAHVSDADFRAGRTQVLESYLARPRIYLSEAGTALWEIRARANIAGELDNLRATS